MKSRKNTKEKSMAKRTRVAGHLGIEWKEKKI
jgi:hypothetical protein